MHPRQAIRQQVVTMLTGQTAAGARVYPTRVLPWRAVELPAIGVYTLEETVDAASRFTAPRYLQRNLQLAVELRVRQADNVDAQLDTMAQQVERVLSSDPYLANNVQDTILSSTEITLSPDGDEPIGMGLLTFTVLYETASPGAADQTLASLNTVDAKTSLGGVQAPADQTEQTLTNLED